MTWDLQNSVVDLYGTLSFAPDVAYWLDAANTYRVVFIQVPSLVGASTDPHFLISV
jgi:galacturan 1,4-alpha-galacturonidase